MLQMPLHAAADGFGAPFRGSSILIASSAVSTGANYNKQTRRVGEERVVLTGSKRSPFNRSRKNRIAPVESSGGSTGHVYCL
jgi:hypothetical protein